MTKELFMFARRGAPLVDGPRGDEPPIPRRSPAVEEQGQDAAAYRVVTLIGAVVSIVGALAVVLARWRYAHPPHRQMVDLEGTFLVTFGTQLGVTALAFGLPLALGGAVLWLRARGAADTSEASAPAEMPRAVVVSRAPRRSRS